MRCVKVPEAIKASELKGRIEAIRKSLGPLPDTEVPTTTSSPAVFKDSPLCAPFHGLPDVEQRLLSYLDSMKGNSFSMEEEGTAAKQTKLLTYQLNAKIEALNWEVGPQVGVGDFTGR